MNELPSAKCKVKPNIGEKKSLESDVDRKGIDFNCLEKVGRDKDRLDTFEEKIYLRKTFNLISQLEVEEEVLVLVGGLNKKDSSGEFYKSSIENKSYFSKKLI